MLNTHDEHFPTNLTMRKIKNMNIGESGWTVLTSMVKLSSNHKAYINTDASYTSEPLPPGLMKVIRTPEGFYVDISVITNPHISPQTKAMWVEHDIEDLEEQGINKNSLQEIVKLDIDTPIDLFIKQRGSSQSAFELKIEKVEKDPIQELKLTVVDDAHEDTSLYKGLKIVKPI